MIAARVAARLEFFSFGLETTALAGGRCYARCARSRASDGTALGGGDSLVPLLVDRLVTGGCRTPAHRGAVTPRQGSCPPAGADTGGRRGLANPIEMSSHG